jgi:hypothetical protein
MTRDMINIFFTGGLSDNAISDGIQKYSLISDFQQIAGGVVKDRSNILNLRLCVVVIQHIFYKFPLICR